MGETDLISRQAAIDAVMKYCLQYDLRDLLAELEVMPSAQPESHYDEWCHDCKEYDHERHCCPRWNKVIREALKDAQPEVIRCKDCAKRECCRTSIVWAVPPPDDWYCADAESYKGN